MAKKQESKKESTKAVDSELTSTENFFDKNKKIILGLGIGVIAILIGWIGYQELVKKPKDLRSQEELAPAFYDFEKDSVARAINGTDNYLGMADIASEYKGTSGGDIANYSMGIMSMRNGEFEEALGYLEDCSFDDEMVGNLCLGLIGDCHVELGDIDEAASYFEKAANRRVNEFTTPMFLKKAGLAYEELGNKEKANQLYSQIEAEYPSSTEGADISKYIGRTKS
ncbi:MAG: tetratricopeptide repeat protein [Crocinitomicaceae bacterium]